MQGDAVGLRQTLHQLKADLRHPQQTEQGMMQLAALGDSPEVIDVLIDFGANIEEADVGGNTPLAAAIHKDNANIIRRLVSRGANIEALNNEQLTPLQIACLVGSTSAAKELVVAGAAIDRADPRTGSTPLHYCALSQDDSKASSLVALLASKGVDVDARNVAKETPLHIACRTAHTHVARALLQAGANPTSIDVKGETPLVIVIQTSPNEQIAIELTTLLITHGAERLGKSADGKSVAEIASGRGFAKVLELISSP
jgi:ankyrin repeat protein